LPGKLEVLKSILNSIKAKGGGEMRVFYLTKLKEPIIVPHMDESLNNREKRERDKMGRMAQALYF
jgi:hypothetical protein